MKIESPVFAIVTPMNPEGQIDFAALRDYLQFLHAHNVPAVVSGGTTGEFASLTVDERLRLLEACRRDFAGAVIAHVSSCSTQEAGRLLDHAREHADAALLLPPFYFARPSAEGVTRFFREVVSQSRIPIYFYNFPEHTQFEIDAEVFPTLANEFEIVAGIKDSGGKLELSKTFKSAVPRAQVLVGSDRKALEVLQIGLDGSVTGGANPVPEALVQVNQRFRSGDLAGANQAQRRLDAWTDLREKFGASDLVIAKAALGERIRGFPSFVRSPFVNFDEKTVADIRAGLRGWLSSSVD